MPCLYRISYRNTTLGQSQALDESFCRSQFKPHLTQALKKIDMHQNTILRRKTISSINNKLLEMSGWGTKSALLKNAITSVFKCIFEYRWRGNFTSVTNLIWARTIFMKPVFLVIFKTYWGYWAQLQCVFAYDPHSAALFYLLISHFW